MTNDKIVEALESFGYPVFYNFDDGDIATLNNWNFFSYSESAIRKSNCKYYQDIEIIFVSEKTSNPNFFEIDIIEKIEKLGLKLNGDGQYEHFRKANTNDFVDTITLTFTRPISRRNESSF